MGVCVCLEYGKKDVKADLTWGFKTSLEPNYGSSESILVMLFARTTEVGKCSYPVAPSDNRIRSISGSILGD